MKLVIDMRDREFVPRRGDLVYTNIGNRRERTCFILHAHRVGSTRFHLWAERWWELEPDFRMRLYRSAERRGGQHIIGFVRYKARKNAKTKFRTFPV